MYVETTNVCKEKEEGGPNEIIFLLFIDSKLTIFSISPIILNLNE